MDSMNLAPAAEPVANTDAASPAQPSSGFVISDVLDHAPAPRAQLAAADHETHEVFAYTDPLKPTATRLIEYSVLMRRMVQAAQLNDRYVDGYNLPRWFEGLGGLGYMPGQHRVKFQSETGLPDYPSWGQVRAARNLAQTAGAGSNLQRINQLYATLPSVQFNNVQVDVLDVDPESKINRFRVYHDRWVDPGFIVRTTMFLEQPMPDDSTKKKRGKSAADDLPMRFTGEEWVPETKLKDALTSATGGSPATFVLLADYMCGKALTGVTQGIVGPVWFKGVQCPELIGGLLDISPKSQIACFTAYEITRAKPEGEAVPWFDPGDAALERIRAAGWHANIDKVWVVTPELREALEQYAHEMDPSLKVRTIF
jgi:hypothetical protein